MQCITVEAIIAELREIKDTVDGEPGQAKAKIETLMNILERSERSCA